MITEETKTKFSLPKSRIDFSYLSRGHFQQPKFYRGNFKRYSNKKYTLLLTPDYNDRTRTDASQISLDDDQHFGETKHVEVSSLKKNFHKFPKTKSTHSKERKYRTRSPPQLPHSLIKETRKLGGSSEFSIIDRSENESNMPVFPNFPQVSNFRKSISGSGKQRRSESLSYNENPQNPQKFISNIATLVSTSWN